MGEYTSTERGMEGSKEILAEEGAQGGGEMKRRGGGRRWKTEESFEEQKSEEGVEKGRGSNTGNERHNKGS